MSVVSLLNVNTLNNPAKFSDKFQFEITFECLEPLTKDLEWKLTYVGSATSSEHDQVLDSMLVGPIPVGVNKFVLEADPPNPSRIPSSEVLGVTVLLLTCSYDEREFIRVGYYVNNEYDNEEMNTQPPNTIQFDRLVRNVLAEKPRVTRFAIKWDSEESAPQEFPPDQPEADLQEADGDQYGAEEGEPEESELEGEAEGGEAAPADPDAMEVEDTDMGGTEGAAAGAEGEVEATGDESEDLEESSEEEYDEEEEGEEGEGDEEMGEGAKQGDDAMATDSAPKPPAEVMAQN